MSYPSGPPVVVFRKMMSLVPRLERLPKAAFQFSHRPNEIAAVI
jgi:hypothetical protein